MLEWAAHPVLESPSDEEMVEMEVDELLVLHQQYHAAIKNAQDDPLKYGFRMPHWDYADQCLIGEDQTDELVVLGGNRSGKTIYGARTIIRAALDNPGSLIFAFAQNAEVSIRQIQGAVYDWLPPELRRKQTTEGAYISFKRKTGFSGGSAIFPNGSQIVFKHYSQFQQDNSICEGAELGSCEPSFVNIGAWCDEYLIGEDLINTLRFRLADRNAKLLLTFTPIFGYTEVVRDYLFNANTLRECEAELLPGEMVPLIQRSHNRNASIAYFHSISNPFGGYPRIKRDLEGSAREEILTRAYGVPVRSSTTIFPKFSREVNVVPPEQIPQENTTRFFLCDPGGAKNWFCLWVAITADGTWWIYREYPDDDAWSVWREGRWGRGPAAHGRGHGIPEYIRLFYELEGGEVTTTDEGKIVTVGGETIRERIIDPRMCRLSTPSRGGGSEDILSNLDSFDFVCLPSLIPNSTVEGEIQQGLQALNDLMAYDTARPIDSVNRPRFYVSEKCENFISAMAEYTGEGGQKESWKDPIDCARYGAISGIEHEDKTQPHRVKSGALTGY
tara:strand:- start:3022 stop:4695 length:1674 start_codon:yes stop_codon:yes gene_type:complete